MWRFKIQYGQKPAANKACEAMVKQEQITWPTNKLHEQENFGGDNLMEDFGTGSPFKSEL